ncbi:MAG: siphovirus ReqiPepy6 Gp37-like family protein [Eubacteriales bacterium]
MDVIFLNQNFEAVSAPIDDYTSCVFTPCYYSAGSFFIVLGKSKYPYVKNASYIYNSKTGAVGIIDSVSYKDVLTVSGKLLEAILDSRVINDVVNTSGGIETISRALVTKYAITAPRKITKMSLGDIAGFSTIVDIQPKLGDTLSTALRSILTPYEISYTCIYDYLNDDIKFKLYKGLDRTQAQNINTWAVFSADYENLIGSEYKRDNTDFKNYAYIVAENDDIYGRVSVEIDNIVPGDIRRELFVNASSIKSKDDAGNTMSYQEFVSALTTYGQTELLKHSLVETVEGEIDGAGNLKYRRDYDIGDLCDIVIAELGLVWSARITEIDEVYEGGSVKCIPRFGDGSLTLREFIRREMR